MDLKSFAEDDFDPKTWINKTWSSSGNQEKEIFVANTVSRLQLYMKQLTNSLDDTMTQIVTSLPKVLQEATDLQVSAAPLQVRLETLEREVASVEERTGHSVQGLQRTDTLKSQLENAASALKEADKWAALANSLETSLEAGVPTETSKLDDFSGRVADMSASLEVLSDAPDYEEKSLQLETLYNRIEAAVSAPLLDALTAMDAVKTSSYVSLFLAMRRRGPLARAWRSGRARRGARLWARSPALSGLRDLASANTLQEQMHWLTDVLKSDTPVTEIFRLYTDLLLSLDPTPSKIVSAHLKLVPTPQEGIEYLTDVRRELDELMSTFTALLDNSRNVTETVPTTTVRELGRAVYAPLRDSLPTYTRLQTQAFNLYIEKTDLEQDDILECSRAFQSIVERSEVWLKSAFNSAKEIAGNALYTYYMPAVETFISNLASKLSRHSRRIAQQRSWAALPAALALRAAAGGLIDLRRGTDEIPEIKPLSIEDYLQEEPPSKILSEMVTLSVLRRECDGLRMLANNVLREPVKKQLDTIPSLTAWGDNDELSTDLPDFALSPQEYITEVGQYLMTLPQHLEMHFSDKESPLVFLNEVCLFTCELYAEKIKSVKNMDALGTKRCLTDIVYLSSVVEDLGSSVTPSLKNLEKTLRSATTPNSQDQ